MPPLGTQDGGETVPSRPDAREGEKTHPEAGAAQNAMGLIQQTGERLAGRRTRVRRSPLALSDAQRQMLQAEWQNLYAPTSLLAERLKSALHLSASDQQQRVRQGVNPMNPRIRLALLEGRITDPTPGQDVFADPGVRQALGAFEQTVQGLYRRGDPRLLRYFRQTMTGNLRYQLTGAQQVSQAIAEQIKFTAPIRKRDGQEFAEPALAASPQYAKVTYKGVEYTARRGFPVFLAKKKEGPSASPRDDAKMLDFDANVRASLKPGEAIDPLKYAAAFRREFGVDLEETGGSTEVLPGDQLYYEILLSVLDKKPRNFRQAPGTEPGYLYSRNAAGDIIRVKEDDSSVRHVMKKSNPIWKEDRES